MEKEARRKTKGHAACDAAEHEDPRLGSEAPESRSGAKAHQGDRGLGRDLLVPVPMGQTLPGRGGE